MKCHPVRSAVAAHWKHRHRKQHIGRTWKKLFSCIMDSKFQRKEGSTGKGWLVFSMIYYTWRDIMKWSISCIMFISIVYSANGTTDVFLYSLGWMGWMPKGICKVHQRPLLSFYLLRHCCIYNTMCINTSEKSKHVRILFSFVYLGCEKRNNMNFI